MQVSPLGAIQGAFVVTPTQHSDDRGVFLEWFSAEPLAARVGHRLQLEQANHSISRAGTVRGIHFAAVPPSQAKYVYCPAGAVLDIVIDIRTGSPTFGAVEAVRLDPVDRRAVYLAEGLGHAFVALTEDACVTYLCSTGYAPAREHAINPADQALGLAALDGWPEAPLLSPRDLAAPTLREAESRGLLPSYRECLDFYAELARG